MTFLLVSNSHASLINFRLDLIKALLSLDIQVHVAAPGFRPGSGEVDVLNELGVETHDISISRSGLNPFADLRTFWELIKLMKKIKPKYVLNYTIKPVVWGSLAAFLSGVPYRFALITGLGYAFAKEGKEYGRRALVRYIAQSLYSVSLRKCDRVFFQNPDDELLFRSLSILQKEASTTIVKGSGVNLEHFKPESLPIDTSFILIARLLVDKGIREYAAAAKRLKEKYPQVTFKMVGYLDENPESIGQDELDSWVSEGYIDFLGKLSDVRPAIASASVFVLPSYREGTPRSTLEAMSMGRAVVTTDAPGCRETVRNSENGFLVQPKSVDDLADAMERLIQNPSLIAKMGVESLARARDEFDVHKVNAVMLKSMGIK